MNKHLIEVLESQRSRAVLNKENRKEELHSLWMRLMDEYFVPSYEVQSLYSLAFNEGADSQKVMMIDSQLRELRRESGLKRLFNKILKK